MFRQPPFRDFPAYLKLLSLLLVIISTALLVMAIGMGLGIIIFGKDVLTVITQVENYSDPMAIAALKFFQIINQFGVFVLPALLFVSLTDNNISGYLRLDGGWHLLSILFGVVLIVVSLPLTHWLMDMNSSIHLPDFMSGVEEWMKDKEQEAQEITDAFLATGSIRGFLVNLLMIAVIAAIGEELIFRGILVKLFHEWTGSNFLAVFIPAFIFSALHLQFYGFFPRLVLGMFLGYLFIWTGSLYVPVIIHFINNAFAVTFAFLDSRGLMNVEVDRLGASDDTWVITASVVLTLAMLAAVYYHERRAVLKKEIKKAGVTGH